MQGLKSETSYLLSASFIVLESSLLRTISALFINQDVLFLTPHSGV
jgi:hypothetical protein